MRLIAAAASRVRVAGAALALLALAACRSGPRPIAFGQDGCAYCLMQINDARYAAELVTHTGKVYTFDSIECLVSYYRRLDAAGRAGVETMWVSDYAHPATLVAAPSASFLRVAGPGSPMGRGMVATSRAADLEPLRGRAQSASMTWEDVLTLADREQWDQRDPAPAGTVPMPMIGSPGVH